MIPTDLTLDAAHSLLIVFDSNHAGCRSRYRKLEYKLCHASLFEALMKSVSARRFDSSFLCHYSDIGLSGLDSDCQHISSFYRLFSVFLILPPPNWLPS